MYFQHIHTLLLPDLSLPPQIHCKELIKEGASHWVARAALSSLEIECGSVMGPLQEVMVMLHFEDRERVAKRPCS